MFDSDKKVDTGRSFHESDYYDSSSHRPRKRRSKISKLHFYCICCVFSVIAAILALLLTIITRLQPITSSLLINSSLIATQTLHIRELYCKKVTIGVKAEMGNFQANMYLLKEIPTNFSELDYEVNVQFVIGNVSKIENEIAWFETTSTYDTWRVILNPGSKVDTRACVSLGSGKANYLVIQGENDYNYWKLNSGDYDEKSFLLSRQLQYCTSSFDLTIPFSSEEIDQYFFVFMATEGQPLLDLKFEVSSKEYSLNGYSGLPNCTANTTDSCSLETPPLKYHHVLLEVPPPMSTSNQSVPYGLLVELEWTCDCREWAYLLLFCLLFLCGECIFCLSCCCCCLCYLLCFRNGNNAEQQPLIKRPFSHTVVKIGPSTPHHRHPYLYTYKPGPAHGVKSGSSNATYSAGTQFVGL